MRSSPKASAQQPILPSVDCSRRVLRRKSGNEGVAFVLDLSEQKRAAEILRTTQAELARSARLTMMGELAASIAHEINQPLAAIVMSSNAGLRWLNKEKPDLEQARNAFSRMMNEGIRAGNVIRGLRAMIKKNGPEMAKFNINDAIQGVLAASGWLATRQ